MKEKSLFTNTEKESKLRNTGIFFQSIRKISWYKLIFNLLLKTLKKLWRSLFIRKFKYIIFILPGIFLQLT